MKRTLFLFLAGTMLAANAAAQAPSAAPTAAAVAPGTTFNAVLVGSVDSKRLKAGDAVAARTTEAVVSAGAVVFPQNTRLLGHVTQAAAKTKGDPESALAFQFDRAVLKSGQEIPLNAVLQALAPPQELDLATPLDTSSSAAGSGGGSTSSRNPSIMAAGGTVNNQVNAAVNSANRAAATSEAASNAASPAAPTAAGAATSPRGGRLNRGLLAPDSKGVLQMSGLTLTPAASASTPGPVLSSYGQLVRLDSGTRLLLMVPAAPVASSKP